MNSSSTFALSKVPLYRDMAQHHQGMSRDHQPFLTDQMHPPLAALSPRPYSSERVALPKVGQTRCYWALLSTSLQFLVLDPVLEHHLQDQATRFLDCSLLDFVHPDEKHSAQRDLGSVLEEQTLHGSVTRVRYCRLSRVRRLLGWSDSSLPYPPNFPAERIAVDSDYMAVYLVVNCVANGMVLCFIHAVVDIAPQADNDEFHKTGWSNWCSTYGFDNERARALYRCLVEKTLTNPKSIGFTVDSSPRVFQILRNQSDRPLVLSWPPDATLQQAGYISPTSDYLARLVQHVRIDYSIGGAGDNDARTSCTRRYKSVQSINLLTTGGPKTFRVESIFIPHGMIIFACHKIKGTHLDIASPYPSMQNHQMQQLTQVSGLEFQGVANNGNQRYDDPMSAVTQQGLAPHAYVQQWINGQSQAETQPDDLFWHNSKVAGNALLQDCWNSDLRCAGNSRTVVGTSELQAETSTSSDSVLSRSEDSALPLSISSTTTHISHLSNKGSRSPSYDMESPGIVGRERSGKERVNGAKNMGSPPTGVVKCAHCQTTHSPEWRKGPSGKKDLCNACGLRFSRSRAKKEGIVSKKRRDKEKEYSSKHSRTQPEIVGATGVSEVQTLQREGSGTESRSGQVLPAPSSDEQLRSNHISSNQTLGRTGVQVDEDPTSPAFFNETRLNETRPHLQVPFFG